jgi:hypothetical protein
MFQELPYDLNRDAIAHCRMLIDEKNELEAELDRMVGAYSLVSQSCQGQ